MVHSPSSYCNNSDCDDCQKQTRKDKVRMRRLFTLTLLLILCFAIFPILQMRVVVAEPKTIVVPDDYSVIQEAIDNSVNGDVVLVKSGTYDGSIVINKSISLIGEDKEETIILGDWSLNGTVILVQDDGVIVKNLTMKAVPNSYSIGRGVHLLHVQNCQVLNCNFQSGIGVWLYGASNNNIRNNQIIGKGVPMPNTSGIKLQQSHRNTIDGNDIRGYTYGYGIFILSSTENDLVGNQISNNYYEVLLRDSNNNSIGENRISTSIHIFMNPTDQGMLESYGIRLHDASNNTMRSNDILSCPKGIRILFSSVHNLIENNTISDSRFTGLELAENVSYNQVKANNITDSGIGVNIRNSSNNIFYNNNFINNEISISVYSIDDINSFDSGTFGNYWSIYNGTDIDGDGKGDVPYIIDGNNQDNFPSIDIIPEFPSWIMLPLFLTVILFGIIIRKKFRSL